MIAKSMLALLLGGGILLSCSQGESPEEIIPGYGEILKEYNIHPPELGYGYPLCFRSHNSSPYLVVFLKDDVGGVISYGESIRVACPTTKSAGIIHTGESDRLDEFMSEDVLTVYIVPDSSVSFDSLMNFIYHIPGRQCSNIRLVGSAFRYSPFKLSNSRYPWDDCYTGIRCGGPWYEFEDRDVMTIQFQTNKELLIDSKSTIKLDSLALMMECYYWDNYYSDVNSGIPKRSYYTVKDLNDKLQALKLAKTIETRIDCVNIYEYEIEETERMIGTAELNGSTSKFSIDAHIKFMITENDLTVSEYFLFLDQFNKGVYESRQKKALETFQTNYTTLLVKHRYPDLDLIEYEFPYRFVHTYCR